MNQGKIFNLFRSRFKIRKSTKNWWRFKNPFDSSRQNNMAVNFEYGIVKDFKTNYKSSIIQFLKIYLSGNTQFVKEQIEKYTEVEFHLEDHKFLEVVIDISLPEAFHLFGEGSQVPFHDRSYNYLEARNLDMDLINERSIGFCSEGPFLGHVVIPFMNPTLTYYIGRNIIGGDPKYLNPKTEDVGGVGKSQLFYNEEALDTDFVFLCEGVFDALSCGERGIAALGWSLSEIQVSKIINSRADIYIVPDKGFYYKALATSMRFIQHKNIYIANLDNIEGKDVNDLGGIKNLKFEKINYDFILKNLKDF